MHHRQALYLKSYLDSLYQCCGSGMFIPDPEFYPSRIPDPGSKNSNKREGWKKICCHNFYVSTNFTKWQIISVLNYWRKKFGPIFKELYNFLTKIVNKFSKVWGWDPGSEVLDPQHWLILWVVGASQLTAREGTCIKFASAWDQTRVACVTGGHST